MTFSNNAANHHQLYTRIKHCKTSPFLLSLSSFYASNKSFYFSTLDDEARRDDNCENDSFSTTAEIFSASTTDSGKESLLSLLSDEESFTSRAYNEEEKN